MIRLFIVTFAVLGWAWYELSGGSEFEAGSQGISVLASVETKELEPVTAPIEPQVSRTDLSEAPLTAVATPAPAPKPVLQLTPAAAPVSPVVVPVAAPSVASADPVIQPVVTQASTTIAASVDYRAVTGSRVNLRSGPGTRHDVVTQLFRGDEVEVLQDPGSGWVQLRSLNGSNVGWMSADFLVAAN